MKWLRKESERRTISISRSNSWTLSECLGQKFKLRDPLISWAWFPEKGRKCLYCTPSSIILCVCIIFSFIHSYSLTLTKSAGRMRSQVCAYWFRKRESQSSLLGGDRHIHFLLQDDQKDDDDDGEEVKSNGPDPKPDNTLRADDHLLTLPLVGCDCKKLAEICFSSFPPTLFPLFLSFSWCLRLE